MLKKKCFLFHIILLIICTLLLASCGENYSNRNRSSKSIEQILRVNNRTEPFSLHPGLANDSASGNILRQMFEGLTRINIDGQPEMGIAKNYKISDDKKTYIFTIRKNIKWSNGDPVTAYDFEYAWKWVLDPKNGSQYAYQLYCIKNAKAANEDKASLNEVGVKAVNEDTLKVQLENPTPYFLELTAFYTYFPINSKIAKENPDWANDAGEDYTSNGPFKMTVWKHNNKILLEKNENYWNEETVKLKKIEMIMINDSNTELNMFNSGELDWAGAPTGEIPLEAISALHNQDKLQTAITAGTYWYKFNIDQKPFNNKKIRKAFAYAIDREAIVKAITKAGQIPAMAVVPITMWHENKMGYFEDNNVEKAKELLEQGLEEEGYENVNDLPKITLTYNTSEAHARIAQAIQDMWRKNLNVEVELDNQEWKVYIDKIHNGNYQIGRMGWLADFNDPINFLELYKEKGGNNNTRWESKIYQRLLNKTAVETEGIKRKKILKQAEKILMDEMPIIPIYFYTSSYVKNKSLKGVIISKLGDVQYRLAYFE